MSHVDVNNLKPSTFEEENYDEYEYYNLSDKYTDSSSRKGRTKKEASDNTNRHSPSGHERKIVVKLQNTEKKAKETLGRLFPDPDHDGPAATERDDETAGSDLKVHLNVKKKSLQMFQMFRLQLLSLLGVVEQVEGQPLHVQTTMVHM
ncbi:hypothetical protein CgunFtcFv8_008013 [Champsocephalus gunnari]|uniref:Nuclear protein 1 n=2 Tax=Champsocephalus TaxID=52236 RepID=A0AAN8CZK7_CHAGU|nr:hypothetical protein CgunFtcFv8_008013 [Champsocephalus gunnari]